MRKISKSKRELFVNNYNDLQMLFQRLVLTLANCELYHVENDNFILKNSSLEIKFSQEFLKEKKIMSLCILKNWSDYFEELIIVDSYNDEKKWIVDEVLEYLSMLNNISKTCINNIKKIKKTNNDKPIYKDYSFAMVLNGMFYIKENTKIEYKTNSIGRGLKSFCVLNKESLLSYRSSIIQRIFFEMIYDDYVSEKLRIITNSSVKKQIDFFRRDRRNLDNFFSSSFKYSETVESLYSDLRIETELIKLCMHYAKTDT